MADATEGSSKKTEGAIGAAPTTVRLVPKALLTYEQAMEILAVGRTTLYGLVGSGDLPVVRLGRRCPRIWPEDLEALIADRVARRRGDKWTRIGRE